MKVLFLSLFALCIAATLQAQPLIIHGKISNATEKQIQIFFEDGNGKLTIDTIKLNDAGEFYLKTYHITRPQRTSMQQNRLQINNIYVAPGYDLHITGDATDYISMVRTRKITGKGAAVNSYRQKMDSIFVARNDRTAWYELALEPLLQYIDKKKKLDDSIYNVVFNKPHPEDKYWNTFRSMIELDNQSMIYYMVLQHLEMNKYSYTPMVSTLNKHTPPRFAKGVSNDAYLLSEDYKSWVMPTYYAYSKKLDGLKDSLLVRKPDYRLTKINALYKGKVRDLFIYHTISGDINRASSIEQLNGTKRDIQARYSTLKNAVQKKDIDQYVAQKEQQLMLMQTGKPAPGFILPGNDGKTYSLSDFKGKVIYIDLWASWCAPCRAEIPNYRALYNKYKNDERIAFIGIAVHDGEREWQKALGADKPEWLQLYDKGGKVAQSYVANAIPKYIIIDQNGNVVNFNAPGPGEIAAENLLKKEMLNIK